MENREKILMFYPHISKNALGSLQEVISGRWIGKGKKVDEFENKVRSLVKSDYAVAVNCASSAIRFALSISGVGPGDEVITTAQTCTATNHPILEQFAKPVFSDIQYETGNIAPEDIEHRITKKTKAILPVHWAGYPCDMDEIHKIAKKHNLAVIEDASDAFGAVYKGKSIGALSSRFTCFSFQAVQQITCGEGGMLCTANKKDFESALRRRWYGIDKINRKPNNIGYYDFDAWEAGYGYHMTNINAAVGLSNLNDFDFIMERRGQIAKQYREGLEGVKGVELFANSGDRKSANQLFTIHVKNRDKFCKSLRELGIETSIVHMRNDAYSVFGVFRKDIPVLDKFSKTNISLPLHTNLRDEDVDYIIKSIKKGW